MTPLEIILIAIVWIAYGVFNSWQWNWYKDNIDNFERILAILFNILLAPIALLIRIFRGVFVWKGDLDV